MLAYKIMQAFPHIIVGIPIVEFLLSLVWGSYVLKLSSVRRFLEGGWNPVPVLLQEFSTREESFIKAKASARIFFCELVCKP